MRWVRSVVAACAAAAVGALGCGPGTVALKPAKTCDGGNVEECRSRCGNNEGRACYRLGWFHEQGENVAESFPRAMELYEQACAASWAVACRALGDVYWRGEKKPRDRRKAIEYWQKACGLGLELACPSQYERDVASGARVPGAAHADGTVSIGVQIGTPDAPDAPKGPSAPSAPDAPSAPAAPSAPTPDAPSVPAPPAPTSF